MKQSTTLTHRRGLLPLLMAAVLLASCSMQGDTGDCEPQQPDILSRFNSEGKAWISLDLQLPKAATTTRSLTRGGDAPTRAVTFDDGTEAEYKVSKLTFVFFSGTSEAGAKVASTATAYTVPNGASTPSNPDDATEHDVDDDEGNTTIKNVKNTDTQVTCTLELTSDNIKPGDNLYLLAVLNAPDGFSPTKEQTLSALMLSSITGDGGNFVMTNAPLATASDGTGSVTTLPVITPNAFQATPDLARSNPAVKVYVERAAAKVTVQYNCSPQTVKGNSEIDFEAKDMAFALDNFNTQCYLTRSFNATNATSWLPLRKATDQPFRMVDATSLPTILPRYRTYWAEDVNYSGNTDLNFTESTTTPLAPPLLPSGTTALDGNWLSMSNSVYCMENTFDVAHQQDNATTSVLVRLKLNGGEDFYTTSVTGQDVIYKAPLNDLTEEGTSASSSFAPRRSKESETYRPIDEYLRQWLMQQSDDVRQWVTKYAAGESKFIEIELDKTTYASTGKAVVTSVKQSAVTSGEGKNEWGDADGTNGVAKKAKDLLNSMTIYYYPKGYCYYRVPIRHFTDDETPAPAAGATSYNNDNNKYLGRYGVVRNNWYTISINSVTHVGSPIIPKLTNKIDDNTDKLLNATLTIASWGNGDRSLE